jgi:hypothetical protein
MAPMQVNLLAVLVCTLISFFLGAAWYSPLLFAKKWVSLLGKTQQDLKQGSNPIMYFTALVTGAVTCLAMEYVVNYAGASTLSSGAEIGLMCWFGFTGATSYNNQVNFVQKPAALWAIDSGYNLASFVITGAILAAWKQPSL